MYLYFCLCKHAKIALLSKYPVGLTPSNFRSYSPFVKVVDVLVLAQNGSTGRLQFARMK